MLITVTVIIYNTVCRMPLGLWVFGAEAWGGAAVAEGRRDVLWHGKCAPPRYHMVVQFKSPISSSF